MPIVMKTAVTERIPYAEITGDVQFYLAMDRKELPGDVVLLLPNDAEVRDSESALNLRFLSSTLPQCWEFNPQNRPSICALLSHLCDTSPTQIGPEANGNKDFTSGGTQTQQVLSDPSSRRETSFNGNEDVASGGLEEGKKLVETSEDPSGSCAAVERAREDWQGVPTDAHPEAEGTNAENSRAGQDASAMERDADREPRLGKNDKAVTKITSYRSLLKISNQPLSTLIWATALILSISANIFLLLRKADSFPSRDQETTRAT
ncbi:hypothetical protein FRC04_009550 [Tulasnella sp. 424]|nr:hypothetical protein FRC04_009550 [Tulasnella sp. 424]